VGKNQVNYFHNPSRRKTNKGRGWWGFSIDFPSQSYKYESQGGYNWTVVETSVNLWLSNTRKIRVYVEDIFLSIMPQAMVRCLNSRSYLAVHGCMLFYNILHLCISQNIRFQLLEIKEKALAICTV